MAPWLLTAWLMAAPTAAKPPETADLEAAVTALKVNELNDARRALRRALKQLDEPAYGGPRRRQVYALWSRWAVAAKKPARAASYEMTAAGAALDDQKARRRHLKNARRLFKEAKAEQRLQMVEDMLVADRALMRLARPADGQNKRNNRVIVKLSAARVQAALSSIKDAQKLYRRARHHNFGRWARALEAMITAQSDRSNTRRTVRRLTRSLLSSKIAPEVRRVARAARFADAHKSENLAAAVAEGAAWNFEVNLRFTEGKRRRRQWEFAHVCEKFDAAETPGACARSELKQTGHATFHLFSRGKAKSERTAEDHQRTHDLHLATLEVCVLNAAKRDPESLRGEELRFGWSIKGDGSTTDLRVRPGRHKERLQHCLDGTVRHFNYPRTKTDERDVITIPLRLD